MTARFFKVRDEFLDYEVINQLFTILAFNGDPLGIECLECEIDEINVGFYERAVGIGWQALEKNLTYNIPSDDCGVWTASRAEAMSYADEWMRTLPTGGRYGCDYIVCVQWVVEFYRDRGNRSDVIRRDVVWTSDIITVEPASKGRYVKSKNRKSRFSRRSRRCRPDHTVRSTLRDTTRISRIAGTCPTGTPSSTST